MTETSSENLNDSQVTGEDDRTGLSIETLRRALADHLFYIQGKYPEIATLNDLYLALAYTVRDRLLTKWLNTVRTFTQPSDNTRVVCYLSGEFLVSPHLVNHLINLGIYNQVRQAVEESGLDFSQLVAQESEPGLGNGSNGGVSACYMDSLSTLEIPAIGYGIRYEFGVFKQEIQDGWQVEITDKWLQKGNPWEIVRPEAAVEVKFGGYTEGYTDEEGNYHATWVPHQVVKGIPYDTPISGYKVNTVNTLRLWKAEAPESFNFQAFNLGDYYGAVDQKVLSENITKVLYPNDEPIPGKQLRLEQQFFLVSCALQDMIRWHLKSGGNLENFPEKFAIQLNDTYPAIAIVELMRLLMDEHDIEWHDAWEITQKTFSYTNHTLLPEALEKWPVSWWGRLLPRHLEIIYEINRRFLEEVRNSNGRDGHKIARLSLIDETGERYVRMANLACLGSHSINGVTELQTELLTKDILGDFYELFPHKFSNKTNGVTPRRWLVQNNPGLTKLISEKIGEHWITHLDDLRQLEGFAHDGDFRYRWGQVKLDLKRSLAGHIQQRLGVTVNPESLFDVQVKPIHEYKRQHLNILHIVTLYHRIKQDPTVNIAPRTFIFAGKAAPGYFMAKLMIKLIHSVAEVINHDPDVGDRLKVVFLPDYNIANSQMLYPAADVSEQISTAGKEVSGTGNMKFSLNGALTIGTWDGANIEICQEVGEENFFRFGLSADEVYQRKAEGYNPWDYYYDNSQLKEIIDLIGSGHFADEDSTLFQPLIDSLLHQDQYMLFADYQSYIDCQDTISQAWCDRDRWLKMSIVNTARCGKFSSDRAIREYCDQIWHSSPVSIQLADYVQPQTALRVDS
ncbi:glycogen/starch/alpha-glucan phosphorylase [Limnospira platensis CENA597]|uniref:glycogen/starch/alpha-glucan phosphorylase n=1 Tax=Limnospira platensis TaxID=118562 RepID=UPI003D6DF115